MVNGDKKFLQNLILAIRDKSYAPSTVVILADDGYVPDVAEILERYVAVTQTAFDPDVRLRIIKSNKTDFSGSAESAFFKAMYSRARITTGPRTVPIFVTDNKRVEVLSNVRKQAKAVFVDARGIFDHEEY